MNGTNIKNWKKKQYEFAEKFSHETEQILKKQIDHLERIANGENNTNRKRNKT